MKHGLPSLKILLKTAQPFWKKPLKPGCHTVQEAGGHGWQARGLLLLEGSRALCRERKKRALPPAASCSCTALHCRYGARSEAGLLAARPPANSVRGWAWESHLLRLMFSCLSLPSKEIRSSGRFSVSSSSTSRFYLPIQYSTGFKDKVIANSPTLLIQKCQHHRRAFKGKMRFLKKFQISPSRVTRQT